MTIPTVFIGIDERHLVAGMVLISSLIRRQSRPTAIVPLFRTQLGIERVGLTGFTYARYLVPQLMNYEGRALFLDSDMIALDDICRLFDTPPEGSVHVVTEQPRFEWPSLMLFNCAECKQLTEEVVLKGKPQDFSWASCVTPLPARWNVCVGHTWHEQPAVIHYTSGIPWFPELRNCDYAEEWWNEYHAMSLSVSWMELMGQSVHVPYVEKLLQEKREPNGFMDGKNDQD